MLEDQIKIRDDYILNALNEFKKKKMNFRINENIKSLDEIDKEQLRLPIIINNVTPEIIKNNFTKRENSANNLSASQNKKRLQTFSPHHSKIVFSYNRVL